MVPSKSESGDKDPQGIGKDTGRVRRAVRLPWPATQARDYLDVCKARQQAGA